MTATATQTTLPLSQLRIDAKSNVRHSNRGLDPILLASIKAIGLRTPLSVRPNGKGYIIFAGGQRFLALQEIAKETNSPDMPVPVIITEENDAAAREASLHENVARSAMHPVDEFRAYSLLANDKDNPLSVDQIAVRFGVSVVGVHQRLALGALDDSVLNAWLAGEIDAKIAKLFTMEGDKKRQKAALEKVRAGNFVNDYNVREALGINQERRLARALTLIGEEAYVARGGAVTRDLFADDRSDNTTISNPELIRTMLSELLDKEVAALKADGWATVTTEEPGDWWEYPRIEVTAKPNKTEAARLKEIDKILQQAEEADESDVDTDALDDEAQEIKQSIEQRALAAIDAKIKAKGVALVELNHNWSKVEITFRKQKPDAKPSTGAGADATTKKKVKPEDAISQALLIRQAEQLTSAAKLTVASQSHVAMALVIAGLASNDDAMGLRQSAGGHQRPKFETALASALALNTAGQIAALTEIAAKNVNLVQRFSKQPVMDNGAHRALAEALDGRKLTAATREKWDAKDHFASVSRATIVEAVREAMGDEHADNVAKMGKADAAKFATANLPKTKWLPKQLRVAAYDGPSKKAKAPAKKAAKKAKR